MIVTCPHCLLYVLIEALNCGIFRHGILKSDNSQIPPHASKNECDSLIANDLIIGCGKPFQIVEENAVVCDYI